MAIRFSGHETFACRYAWLPKALHAIEANPGIFLDEDSAMVELGVGKNMVRSIRFWVEATGMAEPAKGRGLEATTMGRRIFIKGLDPYMEDIQTLWLIHWNLSTHVQNPLFAWEFLFSRWQEPEFTESSALKALAREAQSQSRQLSPVTLQQHLQVFVHSYVPTRGRKGDIAEDNLDCPLTELEMFIRVGEREMASGQQRREPVYAFRREDKPNINPVLFAYCVNDYWQKMFPNEKTLSVRSLATGVGSPGQVFKIPEDAIYARLHDLSVVTDGLLTYSESAALPQVHRAGTVNPQQLIARAYH